MNGRIWLAVHIASLVLGVASLLLVVLAWRKIQIADAIVKYLGLADPDGRVSNRKVLATAGMFGAIGAAVSVTVKSVAAAGSAGDIGGNIVLLWGLILGGFATHSALQAKLNPKPTAEDQQASAARRSSGALVAPPEAKP